LSVGIDYKAFGTSKRFNAALGAGPPRFSNGSFPAMDSSDYRQLRNNSDYGVLVDLTGPLPIALRHFGLRTPQGFDPFFSAQYKRLLDEAAVRFRSNWEFDIEPDKDDLMRPLGVRYVITSDVGPLYTRYLASHGFRPIGSTE